MLVERGRLAFTLPLEDWLGAAADPGSVRVLPVTPDIAAEAAALPPHFHRDPADRLMVATSRVLKPRCSRATLGSCARLVTRWTP